MSTISLQNVGFNFKIMQSHSEDTMINDFSFGSYSLDQIHTLWYFLPYLYSKNASLKIPETTQAASSWGTLGFQ